MRQYQGVLAKAETLTPLPALPDKPPDTAVFNEGPFLSTLLTSLSNIPKQVYSPG